MHDAQQSIVEGKLVKQSRSIHLSPEVNNYVLSKSVNKHSVKNIICFTYRNVVINHSVKLCATVKNHSYPKYGSAVNHSIKNHTADEECQIGNHSFSQQTIIALEFVMHSLSI